MPLVAAVAALAVGGWAGSSGAQDSALPADSLLPSLVSDPPDHQLLETYQTATGTRLLLRFDSYIHNQGQGPLEMRGSAPSGSPPTMTNVVQRIFRQSAGSTDVGSPGQLIYETADGHQHFHLKYAARYSLWNATRTAEVAPAQKAGFCLEDFEAVESQSPPTYSNEAIAACQQFNPAAQNVFEGISPGWRDVYENTLAFQWVDVSDVQPGSYWLRSDVDPNNVMIEANESHTPGYATSPSVVPGYIAQPVSRSVIPGAASTVPLTAATYGTPGARQLRIDRAPLHGTLDVPVGQWLSTSSVRYLPNAGSTANDSFLYSARDTSSPYPLTPARATATLVGPGAPGTVSISGAPARVYAGTSVQLRAVVKRLSGRVAWSVDNVPGGDRRVGTISATGRYRAPAKVPRGGVATIRASLSSAHDQVRIRIMRPPRRTAALMPASLPLHAFGWPRSRRYFLSQPRLGRLAHELFVEIRPARAERVTVGAFRGRRRVARCRAVHLAARRRHTCVLSVPRGVSLGRVVVVLKVQRGGRVARYRARVPRVLARAAMSGRLTDPPVGPIQRAAWNAAMMCSSRLTSASANSR